jgi:hypothetical protein
MLTTDAIEELRAKYGRIHHHIDPLTDPPTYEVVFRKPSATEYKIFRSQLFNESSRDKAFEVLARKIVVHPSAEQFDALLTEWPGIAEQCAKPIQALAGVTGNEVVK